MLDNWIVGYVDIRFDNISDLFWVLNDPLNRLDNLKKI